MNQQFNKSPTKDGDKATASYSLNHVSTSPSHQDLHQHQNYSSEAPIMPAIIRVVSRNAPFSHTGQEYVRRHTTQDVPSTITKNAHQRKRFEVDPLYGRKPLTSRHFVSGQASFTDPCGHQLTRAPAAPTVPAVPITANAISLGYVGQGPVASSSPVRKTRKTAGLMKKPASPKKPLARKAAVAVLQHVKKSGEEVSPVVAVDPVVVAGPVLIDLTEDGAFVSACPPVFADPVDVHPVVIDLTNDELPVVAPAFAGPVVVPAVSGSAPASPVLVSPVGGVDQPVDPAVVDPVAAKPLSGDLHPLFIDAFDVDPVIFDKRVYGPCFADPDSMPFFEPLVFDTDAAEDVDPVVGGSLFEPLFADPVVAGVEPVDAFPVLRHVPFEERSSPAAVVVVVDPVAAVGPVAASPVLRHVAFEPAVFAGVDPVVVLDPVAVFPAADTELVVVPASGSPVAAPTVVSPASATPVAVLRHVPVGSRPSSDADEVFSNSEARRVRKKRRAHEDHE